MDVRRHRAANGWAVISRAIDEGVACGVSRWARKGLAPEGLTEEHLASLRDHLEREVGNALADVLATD